LGVDHELPRGGQVGHGLRLSSLGGGPPAGPVLFLFV
jgi:hypothetical protein